MKEIEIPEGYEARIDGNKVIIELKENEDEKIRKFLINYFKFYKSNPDLTLDVNTWQGEKVSDILSYLEKQKEQKPTQKRVPQIDRVNQVWQAQEDAYMKMMEDDDQYCHPESFRWGFEQGVDWADEHPKEQKPAEMPVMNGYADLYFDEWNLQQRNPTKRQCFEEGMRYAQRLQKPAEWSEEDDALLKEIVSFFKDGTVKLQHDLNLYAGFLEKKFKSLRPYPHWKPSKKQMEALEDAFRKDGGNEYRKVINSLYCDLQKLL